MTADDISLLPPEDFSKEVWRLYREALPDPEESVLFNKLIQTASALGMHHVQGLLFVIDQRARTVS